MTPNSPESMTLEQKRVVKRLDRALKDAASLGLSVRVFDGAVLITQTEAISDPRYGECGGAGREWIDEMTVRVGFGIDADGGAGV